MSFEECMFEILVGIFLIYIGYQIGWRGNIRLLHSYHYLNVSEQDVKPFTQKVGIGTIVIGAGILVMPLINWLIGSEIGYYIGAASMAIGVILMICTIIKYNGALISFHRKR